jgi:hypothetical protein
MLSLIVQAALAADVTISVGDDLSSLTSSLRPGDNVLFQPGTYDLPNPIVWTGVGTADQPITLKADGGEVIFRNISYGYGIEIRDSAFINVSGIIVTGDENAEANGYSGILVYNSTDIVVEDCAVRDVWGTGVRIDGDVSRLTLQRVEVSGLGNGTAIYVGCGDASCWLQDSLIQNNLLHDVLYDGIYLSPGTQNVTLTDNVIFRTGANGATLLSTELGAPNIFEGNAVWQTEGDGLYIEGSATIRNNVIFEAKGDGIYTRNGDRDGLNDVVITHNTIARTDGYGANLDNAYSRSGFVFANNAIANPTGYGLSWDDEFEEVQVPTENYLANNIVTGLVEGFDRLAYPNFVLDGGGYNDFSDADGFDFYPRPDATLVDVGDPSGEAYIPATDFNGSAREGDTPDIGAYEYVGGENPGWILQESFKVPGADANAANYDLGGGCCGGGGGQGEAAFVFLPLLGLGAFARRRR